MGTLSPAERDYDNGEGLINELPDDILINIVSPMGMKEAAKTSILSKRWRYLWAKRTHLDFNHIILLPDSDPDVVDTLFFPRAAKNNYINWVNQVVDLHCSPCIDTFRIYYGFDTSYAHHIDKWVRFAVSKKVKNLELGLVCQSAVYTLTFDILKPTLGISDSGINFLQSLYLDGINVSGDILEYLLAQCCLLERLHVEGSETLVRWKVFGSSCKLKQLTIFRTPNLEELEIDAVNLLYLGYRTSNPCTNVVFKNMPMLVEAMFGGYCLPKSTSLFRQLSHLTAHISKLSLELECLVIPTRVLPTFCKLKQLSLMVYGEIMFDLVVINQFLKACPMMHEFTLEITWVSDELEREAYELEQLDPSTDDIGSVNRYDWEYFERRLGIELERTNYPNLKEFKVVGFNGGNADVELVLYLVLFTCNLETVVCDSSRRYNIPVKEVMEASRIRAAKLAKLIPPKISLVIL